MGFDIFVFVERRVGENYEIIPDLKLFNWRNYDLYAFLGGFESKAGIPPLSEERGIPQGSSLFEPFASDGGISDTFGLSWLSVRELVDFDYDATFIGSFRVVEEREGGALTYMYDADAATEMTFRRFLGPDFFDEVARVAASGADRIVFFYA